MKNQTKKYLLRITLLSLFIFVVIALLKLLGIISIQWSLLVFCGLLVPLITYALHFYIIHLINKNPKRFHSYFMLFSMLKLFLFLIMFIICLFWFNPPLVEFALLFLAYYVFFTWFEIKQVLIYFKN